MMLVCYGTCYVMLWYVSIVGYGMVYQYGMVCQYRMMLVCYVMVCYDILVLQGMVWYVSIVGYGMVQFTCMHDLEVETHV